MAIWLIVSYLFKPVPEVVFASFFLRFGGGEVEGQ